MSIQNSFLILSKDTSIDSADGTLSILKIIDRFDFGMKRRDYENITSANPGGMIGAPLAISIISGWISSSKVPKDTPMTLTLEVLDPEKKALSTFHQEVVMTKDTDVMRISISLQGVPFTVTGRYQIKATLEDASHTKLAHASTPLDAGINLED